MKDDLEEKTRERSGFERLGVVAAARTTDEANIESAAPATVFNVSKGGIYLETHINVEIGRAFYIWIDHDLPEFPGKELFARVQWKHKLHDPYASYGYRLQLSER